MTKALCERIGRIATRLDDLLFPEDVICLCCDQALGEDTVDGLCPACARALERLAETQEAFESRTVDRELPEGVGYAHAAYPYESQARKLIHRLKYEGVRAAAVPLAKAMVRLPSGEEEILVPVPADPQREKRRGFNQAAVLAQLLGRELGMAVCPALTRARRSRAQTGLSAAQRKANLQGCMTASQAVRGKRVLLVDDVRTTGATIGEAARALYAAGAKSVCAFTAARALGGDEAQDPFALPDKVRKR